MSRFCDKFLQIFCINRQSQSNANSPEKLSIASSSLSSVTQNGLQNNQLMNIFDQLSLELIELVLLHLDVYSLKSCLEVSKSLRDVIIQSPNIMKKLKLKLTDSNWKSKVPFIIKYGQYVKNVEIYCFHKSWKYYRLLRLMPSTSKLELSFGSFAPDDSYKDDIDATKLINLLDQEVEICTDLNLTKLESLCSSLEIFHELRNVKSLKKFCFYNSRNDEFIQEVLKPFLCQQYNLKYLELRDVNVGIIFSADTIDKMNFKLKTLRIDQTSFQTCDYTHFNQFLLTQSDCLEELQIFSHDCETAIAVESILKLKDLKKLTTNGLLPCFRKQKTQHFLGEEILENLKYFKFYKGNGNDDFEQIDMRQFPNLQHISVHCGAYNNFSEFFPKIELTVNPLKNLMDLKELKIEGRNEKFLKFLSSPNLESLTMSFDDVLFNIESWKQMAENLPKLQRLIIIHAGKESFWKFIAENCENLLKTMCDVTTNERLKLIELNYLEEDLKIFFTNGKVSKCAGTYWEIESLLFRNRKIFKKRIKKFNLTRITHDEYFEKYGHFVPDLLPLKLLCSADFVQRSLNLI